MAEIAPFNGIRYDESVVGELSKVVSPPYDIISPEDRVYYHKLHPNNFVRLILGEEFENDSESDNRFTRARCYLDSWITEGVMKQDVKPSIYVYQQQFESGGKLRIINGFICAVKLHEYADGVILPHENTLAKPKSALGETIRKTQANLDCVYGLYADENGILDEIINRAMSKKADEDTTDKDGVRHLVWVINDQSEIAAVVEFMKDKPIAIADGHHRYETALAFRNEMRSKCGCNCEQTFDYTMMTIANVFQKDMTIYPTHRMLNNLSDEAVDALEGRLREKFEVAESSKENIISDMARLNAIGLYYKKGIKTIKLKSDPGMYIEGCEAARNLELNVLHKLILEDLLGIDKEKLLNQTNVTYTRDADEAMSLVDSSKMQIAFLTNNIEVKVVLDIASAGEKMPQKATYFYPKLLSGLVVRKL